MTGESKNNKSSGRSCSSIFGCLRWNRKKASGPVDPEQIGVDLVAFAVDFHPDVDPTQLFGDSRSTRSFQGRQTCIESS